MIEAIRSDKGQARARVCCDECGREDVIAVRQTRLRGPRVPKAGVEKALEKLKHTGWAGTSKALRCPKCEAKRKVENMAVPKAKPNGNAVKPVREPTRDQKREIMSMLGEVYDVTAECYRRGDTDDTVADVLEVMPGWVAQLREEFFGPSGGNEDIEALSNGIEVFLSLANPALQTAKLAAETLEKEVAKAKRFSVELAAIQRAVGPRVMGRK